MRYDLHMSVPPPDTPASAVTGRGLVLAPRGSHALTTAYSRYLVRCHEAFLGLPSQLPARLAVAAAPVTAFVRTLASRDARSTLVLYASPTIGTPLQCVRLREALPELATRIDAGVSSVTPHVLLEATVRGLLADGQAFAWPATPPLSSVGLGLVFHAPEGSTELRFESGRVLALRADRTVAGSITLADGAVRGFRVEAPYTRVGDVTRLATVDHNPIASFEAHPDKRGNPVDLGGRSVNDWVSALEAAFALVEAYLPELYAEVRWLLHELIPVGCDAEKHLSASYREAIGTVYLTLHPSVLTMTEALVHEFQHNKLNLAAYGTEFIENAYEPLYVSPVRPDPRPLWGILLAVHAFLPVAVLYRRMRDAGDARASQYDGFTRRLAEVDRKNHEGMQMLRENARWTPSGRALFDELDVLDRAHTSERSSAVSEFTRTGVDVDVDVDVK